jgi:YidC/Oxa1 family membrane protein insertase
MLVHLKAHTGGFTTVTTDLLTVEISHKGGTIQNAYLDGFPVEKGGVEKFQLLSDKTGALFQAQSGLASRFLPLINQWLPW